MDEIMNTVIPEETPPEIVRNFATIGAVYADGVSLIFDGEDTETTKHYLCNTNIYVEGGDRVRIMSDSGTYIVEYVVGLPRTHQINEVPEGGTEGQVLTINSSNEPEFLDPSGGPGGYADGVKNQSTGPTQNIIFGLGSSEYRADLFVAPEGSSTLYRIRASSITNAANISPDYNIQFRCESTLASTAPVFYIKMSGSNIWRKITTT